MPTFDFICLDCREAFSVDRAEAPEPGGAPCPRCGSDHVRQSFESYLRNALASPREFDLEEFRACHYG